MSDPSKPWKLTQFMRGVRAWPFATLDKAQKQFDQIRFNSRIPTPDAAIFGPKGETWWCAGTRYAQWIRDDERRKRQPLPDDEEAAA